MKFSHILKSSFLISCICTLVSCDDDGPTIVNSDTVATGQIFATYQVIADGSDYVYAEAQFTRLNPPSETEQEDAFVQLVNDDQLWLAAGDNLEDRDYSDNAFNELQQLRGTQARFKASTTQTEIYDFIFFRTIINPFGNWYSAQLPRTENQQYEISLFREGTTQAKHSTVTLPQNFSLISPTSLDLYSRSQDDVIVEWNNTESDLSVEIEATVACPNQTFDSFSATISNDNGIYVIPAGTLANELVTGRCTTTINVRKAKTGTLDANFIGGLASGYQIRRTSFVTED